jgi:nitrite reductase/ring-hydroxylating ferredoxin subunit
MLDENLQMLCHLEEIPDGDSKGFLADGGDDQVFAVRQGSQVSVYLNSCPHHWVPMEMKKDMFLSADKETIMCYGHGARFAIATGECIEGVCTGTSLINVPVNVDEEHVMIPQALPEIPDT